MRLGKIAIISLPDISTAQDNFIYIGSVFQRGIDSEKVIVCEMWINASKRELRDG